MPNIVETLDRLQAIYAPLMGTMMFENRSFAGIETTIREDNPSAYPTADVPPGYASGYTDEAFEAKASEALRPLVEPTYEIIRGCSPVADDDQPLLVWARRLADQTPERDGGGSGVSVCVALTGGLGGVRVMREAVSLKHVGCFVLLPASLTITTTHPGMSDRQVEEMKSAASQGLREVAEYLESNRLTLSWSPDYDPHLAAWVRDFPDAGAVRVVEMGQGIFQLHADSGFQAAKLLMTEEFAAANPDAVALFENREDVVVERIGAVTTAPRSPTK